MCGLAGLISEEMTPSVIARVARAMSDRVAHRGPDDAGLWTSADGRVALAHRRLSIYDLSDRGRQPMSSPSGRYTAIFNGAIYNHLALRRRLESEGQTFAGRSDTEVLVALFDRWGIPGCFDHLQGMFSIVAWDNQDRRLIMVRDRAGKRPLYYGRIGKTFAFASELKPFLDVPGFARKINPVAATLYLRRGYVPSPHCIFDGLAKLVPGHYAEVKLEPNGSYNVVQQAYWRRSDVQPLPDISYDAAKREAEARLIDAVGLRHVADVPVGALLSGGYDSTAVVALLQQNSSHPVRTFTVGSSDAAFDESQHARNVARHLGTDHTELMLEPATALDIVNQLPEIYDEPFADESEIPTVLVARMARTHVKVAVSGDGGDEIFGGYSRHRHGPRLWRAMRPWPRGLRSAIAAAIEHLPPALWNAIATGLSQWRGRTITPHLSDGIVKAARALPATSVVDLYDRLLSAWRTPTLRIPPPSTPNPWYDASPACHADDPAALLMYLDYVDYLPDDICVKIDRATMAVGLEGRAPFLDHRLVEFMASLPTSFKIDGTVTKRMLRDIVHDRVPREMMERPKAGFDVPIAAWLRGPLRNWANDLLSVDALAAGGLLDPVPVQQAWSDHLSRRRNRQQELWCVLMLQAWTRRYNATI